MDIIVTDLPEPDSPTTPRSSPGLRSKLIVFTAWTSPFLVEKTTLRSCTVRTEEFSTAICLWITNKQQYLNPK